MGKRRGGLEVGKGKIKNQCRVTLRRNGNIAQKKEGRRGGKKVGMKKSMNTHQNELNKDGEKQEKGVPEWDPKGERKQ